MRAKLFQINEERLDILNTTAWIIVGVVVVCAFAGAGYLVAGPVGIIAFLPGLFFILFCVAWHGAGRFPRREDKGGRNER